MRCLKHFESGKWGNENGDDKGGLGDRVFAPEIFVSAPANVPVVRLTCSAPGRK